MAITPVVPTKEQITLGLGRIIKNFGETDQSVIGATRGGSVLTVTRVSRNLEFDGKRGATMGLDIVDTIDGTLAINALSVHGGNFDTLYSAFVKADNSIDSVNYDEFKAKLTVELTDYLTNIAFVGETADGDGFYCILDNAINLGDVTWTFTDRDELVANATFEARIDPTTPNEVAVRLGYQKSA